MRWTFDERINDGFYCATGLKIAQAVVEDPERYIGAANPADREGIVELDAHRAPAKR